MRGLDTNVLLRAILEDDPEHLPIAVGRADFADYLVGWQNWKAGCRDTLTFDRKMRAQEGFLVLSL